jgi:lysophospholipase L1-like esterase
LQEEEKIMAKVRWRKIVVQASWPFALLALMCLPQTAEAGTDGASAVTWYASWAASPFDAHSFPAAIIAPTVETVTNQTLRQMVTISRGGSQLRVRISNEFGNTTLHIGAASVGYRPTGAAKTKRIALTFGDSPFVNVPAGAPIISDPISLQVPNGADLEVSIYIPDKTPISTFHLLGLQQSEVSGPGNFTMAASLPGAVSFDYLEKMSGHRLIARPFLSEVDIADSTPARTVIAFGDSITDGQGSTPNKNDRWPDFLARRIVEAGLHLAVVNEGIGGNQVLANGLGVGALGRFDRDALALPGASTVILMEGINDIGFSGGMIPGKSRPDVIPPEDIIQGYLQLIARCHARGLKIIGATMTPFAGSPAFTPAKEAVRVAVNEWIRTSGAFDAVIDFDAATRDPQQPDRLRSDFAFADHIHLNDAGYKAMASVVDLSSL